MKFTPQDFEEKPEAAGLEEEPRPEKKRKPRKEKEKKEKPEKKKGRRRKEPEPEPVSDESEPVSDETVPIDLDGETTGFEEVEQTREESPKKTSGRAIAGIILILILGFCLFTIGLRGVINSMALEDISAYTPAKSYDDSYQAALDASVEDFEKVNQERLDAKADDSQETTETENAEASEEEEIVPDEPEEYAEEGITAEDLENTTSKDEQIQLLQEEVDRLTQEAEDAKNDAALKEQELSQAQSLLEASEAREAQLRSELDAISGETK